MCKLAAFYEGGISYSTLDKMPLSEFFEVLENANEIAAQRKKEMEKK